MEGGKCASSQAARPPSPSYSSSLPPALNFSQLSRPRKPRDAKPKVKKLKYHQYIPPDQRGGAAGAAFFLMSPSYDRREIANSGLSTGGGAKQKSPSANQYIDPASSSVLKQQQVFLQLQILQNHQQMQQQPLAVVTRCVIAVMVTSGRSSGGLKVLLISSSGDPCDLLKSSGGVPLSVQPVPTAATQASPASKSELLPADLDDLTVRNP